MDGRAGLRCLARPFHAPPDVCSGGSKIAISAHHNFRDRVPGRPGDTRASGAGRSGGDPNGKRQNSGALLGSVLSILRQSARQGDSYTVSKTNWFGRSNDGLVKISMHGLRNP